jgi:hypothetical protein
VPSYRDGNISLFESGAIVLHIGRGARARQGMRRDGRRNNSAR